MEQWETNMKLMSKALSFYLRGCIGVISEEGPCPCASPLSTLLSLLGSDIRRARAAHLGKWEEWSYSVWVIWISSETDLSAFGLARLRLWQAHFPFHGGATHVLKANM
ncbi:hypothetical protein PAMP_022389 [Pampus punctatissimus]